MEEYEIPSWCSDEGYSSDGKGKSTVVAGILSSPTPTLSQSNGEDEKGEVVAVNTMDDVAHTLWDSIDEIEMKKFNFLNRQVAYDFYNFYARVKGFSIRKSKVLRNKKGEIVRQDFVCHKEGFREEKNRKRENRKRETKVETRCGCIAKLRIRLLGESGRWHVALFGDCHNHAMLEAPQSAMLPAHRHLNEGDILGMNSMRKAGISTTQIYNLIADQSGGFEKTNFLKVDMLNQMTKQKQREHCDAKAVLVYLKGLGSGDPGMFWSHHTDEEGKLKQMFWADGISRMDFQVFGEVLAFDATYRKNKYGCPIVVLVGVNHHCQTIVFGTAILTNEKEETYVWVLEQFLAAMKGKEPSAVITDGDPAMRNAITRILPRAHHCLCAWHLLQNAQRNVGDPNFTKGFKSCMLGNLSVGHFKKKWAQLVSDLNLGDNPWVQGLYEKRHMWATCLMRGKFFAGFRTTSRCEGLHSQIGRIVRSRNSLLEFVQYFERYVNYMRWTEVEADYKSVVGDAVLQTNVRALERTVFLRFRPWLNSGSVMKVAATKETSSCIIYSMYKYCKPGKMWYVAHDEKLSTFRCSCQRMETFGLPCDHIIGLLVHLDIDFIPETLVLQRWCKAAKECMKGNSESSFKFWESTVLARLGSLVMRSREMFNLGCESMEDYLDTVDVMTQHVIKLKAKKDAANGAIHGNVETQNEGFDDVTNPSVIRSKGCGGSSSGNGNKAKRKCTVCKMAGHNKTTCPQNKRVKLSSVNEAGTSTVVDEELDISDCVASDGVASLKFKPSEVKAILELLITVMGTISKSISGLVYHISVTLSGLCTAKLVGKFDNL
ncbi:protein FAR1-RELATED SEQUENCE 5-like [Lotus japonicus]|uniref:protein FAR1-RELATED SEQUENCE 5-like n=1 Tax=Lotus japonicus TaxID=34305 RepID=UPI002589D9E0|nr:protein FAR1-RELATED SEQUENCE 5-like [Lotus japonicus]